jgi:16S rRNA (adenine1518-N6/adenine1519-N6)-dimethyltransferase
VETPQKILKRRGLTPKYSWGQNFLGDPRALEQIASAVQVVSGEPVVELGPGLGHLTRVLLAHGAEVTAVERDPDMVQALTELASDHLRVVAANAAQTQFAAVAGKPEVAVVGNLPYHLTSPILFAVLEQHATVHRAVFTIQKEVAERLSADPGGRTYGLLTVLLGLYFQVDQLFVLPAGLFYPPPKVDSAVIRLTRLPSPRADVTSDAHFQRVVKAGFSQRRKTLLNALQSDATLGGVEEIRHALTSAGIDPKRRAETLSVEEFAALERALKGASSRTR